MCEKKNVARKINNITVSQSFSRIMCEDYFHNYFIIKLIVNKDQHETFSFQYEMIGKTPQGVNFVMDRV